MPIADLLAGMNLAYGVLAALHERTRTGRGRVVRTSLLAGVVGVHAFQGTRWTVAGEVPGLAGVAPPGDRAVRHVRDRRPRRSRSRAARRGCGARSRRRSGSTPAEPRFATNRERVAHRDELIAVIEAHLRGPSRPSTGSTLLARRRACPPARCARSTTSTPGSRRARRACCSTSTTRRTGRSQLPGLADPLRRQPVQRRPDRARRSPDPRPAQRRDPRLAPDSSRPLTRRRWRRSRAEPSQMATSRRAVADGDVRHHHLRRVTAPHPPSATGHRPPPTIHAVTALRLDRVTASDSGNPKIGPACWRTSWNMRGKKHVRTAHLARGGILLLSLGLTVGACGGGPASTVTGPTKTVDGHRQPRRVPRAPRPEGAGDGGRRQAGLRRHGDGDGEDEQGRRRLGAHRPPLRPERGHEDPAAGAGHGGRRAQGDDRHACAPVCTRAPSPSRPGPRHGREDKTKVFKAIGQTRVAYSKLKLVCGL